MLKKCQNTLTFLQFFLKASHNLVFQVFRINHINMAARALIAFIHLRRQEHAVGKRTPTRRLAEDNGAAPHRDPVCAGELDDWIQTRGQCDSLCQQSGPLSQPPGDVSLLHPAGVQAGEGQCCFCSPPRSRAATEDIIVPYKCDRCHCSLRSTSAVLFGRAGHPIVSLFIYLFIFLRSFIIVVVVVVVRSPQGTGKS